MYSSFFGLNEDPFNLTPDPKFLYLSAQHREALNHLIYGINERKGFIVISGGIGTGKTTLCRALLASLDAKVDSALIFNSYVTDIELLEAVNQEFGYSMEGLKGARKITLMRLTVSSWTITPRDATRLSLSMRPRTSQTKCWSRSGCFPTWRPKRKSCCRSFSSGSRSSRKSSHLRRSGSSTSALRSGMT